MIDHLGFNVADFAKSRAFYAAALAPLGLTVVTEGEGWAMIGEPGRPQFWFGHGGKPPNAGDFHFAFSACNRATVSAFYQAGLQAGGRDNGPPGLRPHYHIHYYAAFLFDPDGLNIEAVCHTPES